MRGVCVSQRERERSVCKREIEIDGEGGERGGCVCVKQFNSGCLEANVASMQPQTWRISNIYR